MNKYLYCMVKSSPNKLYQEVFLTEEDKDFLKTNNIYYKNGENGKYIVGIFQLRALLTL